eukprot:3327517-Amphidinium_carterae.1
MCKTEPPTASGKEPCKALDSKNMSFRFDICRRPSGKVPASGVFSTYMHSIKVSIRNTNPPHQRTTKQRPQDTSHPSKRKLVERSTKGIERAKALTQ